ncbi:hypothetical protein [Streptomyces sp. DH37]|uniref:hypothetical protein n=1 Tax=Streptomyces sp. DH37 TaxID=3040122 RepID=UPI0024426C00|nr:hypothetical protein [Streptomyces sp. DH37]MDG9702654.1 hypothetical protein [Streptomyces sp. DH37]
MSPVGEPEYRSAHCVIGRHGWCEDGEPRDSGVPGVLHMVCGCGCHPVEGSAAPAGRGGDWYRLCWSARREAPGVEYGVLVGRDVPAMLRGMRGCLSPLAFHDPARVRDLAATGAGWTYRAGGVVVRARRIGAGR